MAELKVSLLNELKEVVSQKCVVGTETISLDDFLSFGFIEFFFFFLKPYD
jgi:hypothetical protein